MKAVKITNSKTGKVHLYRNFKSDYYAENYKDHLVLPEECTLEVIDDPFEQLNNRT